MYQTESSTTSWAEIEYLRKEQIQKSTNQSTYKASPGFSGDGVPVAPLMTERLTELLKPYLTSRKLTVEMLLKLLGNLNHWINFKAH